MSFFTFLLKSDLLNGKRPSLIIFSDLYLCHIWSNYLPRLDIYEYKVLMPLQMTMHMIGELDMYVLGSQDLLQGQVLVFLAVKYLFHCLDC